MRDNIFNYGCKRATESMARVHLPQDEQDDEATRRWNDAEAGVDRGAYRRPAEDNVDMQVVANIPLPATHIVTEDGDLAIIRGGGDLANSDAPLGRAEAITAGVCVSGTQSFVTSLPHQDTAIVDECPWLQPSPDPAWICYSTTNRSPGKSLEDVIGDEV